MLHPDIWTAFLARPATKGTGRGDHPDWHHGRERFFVWALDASLPTVEARLSSARTALGSRLFAPYARQAHVTLAVSGFVTDHPEREDDVAPGAIAAQAARLAALRVAPFELEIGGANSFASAAFLEVGEPAVRAAAGPALADLRDAILNGAPEFRSTPYTPHATIGIYGGEHPTAVVASLLAAVDAVPLILPVATIGLWSYAANSLGSPLRLEQQVRLAP